MLSILYYIFTVIHTTVWCIISALVLAVTILSTGRAALSMNVRVI